MPAAHRGRCPARGSRGAEARPRRALGWDGCGGALPRALVLAVVSGGCGQPQAPGAGAPATAPANLPPALAGAPVSAAQRLEAVAAGDVRALLELTAQSHRELRGQLGPHRLVLTSTSDLRPTDGSTGAASVGRARPAPFAVADRIELLWAAAAGQPVAATLEQHNDQGRGRGMVWLGDQQFVRLEPRPWLALPEPSPLVDTWLDDAARGVHDALALAAPALALVSTRDAAGGLRVELQLATTLSPDLAAPGERAAWRAGATLTRVAGHVELAADGTWRTASVDVGLRLPTPAGVAVAGRVAVEATLTPLSGAELPAVRAPAEASEVPPRARLQLERDALLDGLAPTRRPG